MGSDDETVTSVTFSVAWYFVLVQGTWAFLNLFRDPEDVALAASSLVALVVVGIAWGHFRRRPVPVTAVLKRAFPLLTALGGCLLLIGMVAGVLFLAAGAVPSLLELWEGDGEVPGGAGSRRLANEVGILLAPAYFIAWEYFPKYHASWLAWLLLAAIVALAVPTWRCDASAPEHEGRTSTPATDSTTTGDPTTTAGRLSRTAVEGVLGLLLGAVVGLSCLAPGHLTPYSPLPSYGASTLVLVVTYACFALTSLAARPSWWTDEDRRKHWTGAVLTVSVAGSIQGFWPGPLAAYLPVFVLGAVTVGSLAWLSLNLFGTLLGESPRGGRASSALSAVPPLLSFSALVATLSILKGASVQTFGLFGTAVATASLLVVILRVTLGGPGVRESGGDPA
ncbi:MAG: hypothetical protein ACTSU5_06115 [Promethearchaeota archaeon]